MLLDTLGKLGDQAASQQEDIVRQRQSWQQVFGVNTRCRVESIRLQAVGTCKTYLNGFNGLYYLRAGQ